MNDLTPRFEQAPAPEGRAIRLLFELNLVIRCLALVGVKLNLDVVERSNPAQPDGYQEIIIGGADVPD